MEGIVVLAIICAGFYFLAVLPDFIKEQKRKSRIKILQHKIVEKYYSFKSLDTFDIDSEMISIGNLVKQIAPQGFPSYPKRYQYGQLNYDLKLVDSHNVCPDCKSQLVIRINGKTRVKFLGCSRYPMCTYTKGYDHG